MKVWAGMYTHVHMHYSKLRNVRRPKPSDIRNKPSEIDYVPILFHCVWPGAVVLSYACMMMDRHA
jgi:hypothetical protein